MTPPRIPATEFEDRQRRFAGALAERDLAGAVVWSTGGAAAAWHVDVFYLANHHAQVPQIPANPWLTGYRSQPASRRPRAEPTAASS